MNFFRKLSWPAVLALGGFIAATILEADNCYRDASFAALVGIGFAVLSLRDK